MTLEEISKKYNVGYQSNQQEKEPEEEQEAFAEEKSTGVSLKDISKKYGVGYSDTKEISKPEQPVRKQTAEAFKTKPVVPPEPSIPTGPQENLPDEQQVIPPKQIPTEKTDKTTVTMADLLKPENMKVIRDYAEARFGESGKQKEDESDEDYVGRWTTAMRLVEWNTGMNAVPELNWIYNANDADLLKAAAAHKLYNKIPNFYEKGGEGALKAISEGVFGLLSDPTNLTSFGIGAFAKYKAAKEGIKFAIKDRLGSIAAFAGTEAAVGAGQAAVEQQIKKETGVQEDIDTGTIVLSGALGTLSGAAEVVSPFLTKSTKSTAQELQDIIDKRPPPLTKKEGVEDVLEQRFAEDLDNTLREFNLIDGRKSLDELSPRVGDDPALVVGVVGKDVERAAVKIAEHILRTDPGYSELAKKVSTKETKVSDAVQEVISNIENIDNVALESALSKAGLTPKEFANMALTTVSDAASVMQSYSALSRTINKVAGLDPEVENTIKKMYGRDQEAISTMGKIFAGIRRLERESKALVVSSIGTTVRNMYGTVTGMTFEAGSRAFENVMYGIGSGFRALSNPSSYQKGDFTRGLKDAVRDTFSSLSYLTSAGLTHEITDKLLAHNPKLKDQMFSALQESGNDKLSWVARKANTFNVAQDAFFRRAAFTASVDRQLRNVGLNMYDIIRDGKNVPADILKNAADDALKATFSYMPKPHKKGQQTVEAMTEGLANQFVRFFENIPGGSLLVTFPRFMTNAMAFQYRYSPIGAASGIGDVIKSYSVKDPDLARRMHKEGMEKFSKGTVGMAALLSAYQYRKENQDTEWYNVKGEDGSTVDIRAIFPIGPYLAVGDFIAKMSMGKQDEIKVGEVLESIVGMKMPAGTQSTILESVPELFSLEEGKDTDRLYKAVGKALGDVAGRFIQPGQPVFQYFDLFDRESQIARDPNVLESDNLITEAAINRVKAKLPVFKEDLPEALAYFRDEPVARAGEFFNTLMGAKNKPAANKLEQEFKNLSIDPYAYYASSGDREYDRAVIKEALPFVRQFVEQNLIDSDRYQEMTRTQKKIAIHRNMSTALSVARDRVKGEMSVSDIDKIYKMTFNKLSQRERRAINELYALQNDGRTLDEDKAYDQVYQYKGILEQYR